MSDTLTHLIAMAEGVRRASGSDATVLRMAPELRRALAPALLHAPASSLPPVLVAMQCRERKRANRRREMLRIRGGCRQ